MKLLEAYKIARNVEKRLENQERIVGDRDAALEDIRWNEAIRACAERATVAAIGPKRGPYSVYGQKLRKLRERAERLVEDLKDLESERDR